MKTLRFTLLFCCIHFGLSAQEYPALVLQYEEARNVLNPASLNVAFNLNYGTYYNWFEDYLTDQNSHLLDIDAKVQQGGSEVEWGFSSKLQFETPLIKMDGESKYRPFWGITYWYQFNRDAGHFTAYNFNTKHYFSLGKTGRHGISVGANLSFAQHAIKIEELEAVASVWNLSEFNNLFTDLSPGVFYHYTVNDKDLFYVGLARVPQYGIHKAYRQELLDRPFPKLMGSLGWQHMTIARENMWGLDVNYFQTDDSAVVLDAALTLVLPNLFKDQDSYRFQFGYSGLTESLRIGFFWHDDWSEFVLGGTYDISLLRGRPYNFTEGLAVRFLIFPTR